MSRSSRPVSNRKNLSRIRNSRRAVIASTECVPCFQFARRHRSLPAAVTGPVDAPPCIRQRVYLPVTGFLIAGARQALPPRVFAPQRSDLDGSPDGLPFRRVPTRFDTVVSLCIGSDF